MAKIKSLLFAQASGKLGGVVFATNRGGQYMRRWTKTVNPGYYDQLRMQGVFGNLSKHWTGLLTPGQRNSWSAYAAAVTVTDRLGDQRQISGLDWFIKLNCVRLYYVGVSLLVRNAPSLLTQIPAPTLGSPVCEIALDGIGSVSATVRNNQAPVNPTDCIVVGWVSPIVGTGVNFYKGPWYPCNWAAEMDIANQPTNFSGVTTKAFPQAAAAKVFIELQISEADGRQSPRTRIQAATTLA